MCAAANHYNVIHSKCVTLLVGALCTRPALYVATGLENNLYVHVHVSLRDTSNT